MRTRPPALTDAAVAGAVSTWWPLEVEELGYVPVGFGSHHWEVRAVGGGRWFATVDDLDHKAWLGDDREAVHAALEACLVTARTLRERAGLDFVVAPVPTRRGTPVERISDRYSLALYPFVDGRTGGWDDVPTTDESRKIAHLLARLHAATPAGGASVPSRGETLPGRPEIDDALASIAESWDSGPFGEAARLALEGAAGDLIGSLATWERLSRVVAGRGDRVVTHGEPHPGNIVWPPQAEPLLVDWDQVALAAPERDLWMLAAAVPGAVAVYESESGRTVDETALQFYGLAWELADVAEFLRVLRRPHGADADTEKSWASLQRSLAALRGPSG